MGNMAQQMKNKYNIKDSAGFQKAGEEITQFFDNNIANITQEVAPSVDTSNPIIQQAGAGNMSFEFDLINAQNIDPQFEQSISNSYNSHPQHRSGIWGKANCKYGKIVVTLPSAQAVQNKDRICTLVQDVVQLEGQKWEIQKRGSCNAKKQQLENEKQQELKDLNVLRQLA